MIDFNYWRGAVVAMLCAGPVCISPVVLLLPYPAGPGPTISGLTALIGISILFGAMISFLPIFFGGYFMALWGSRNPRTRHPALWSAVGAVVATVIAAVLFILNRGGDFSLGALFAFTGAVCALIVRFGTRWDDEIPPVPLKTDEGEVK